MKAKDADNRDFYLIGLTSAATGILLVPVEFLLLHRASGLDMISTFAVAFRSCALTAFTVAAFSLPVYLFLKAFDRLKPGSRNRPLRQAIFLSMGIFVLLFLGIFDQIYSKSQALIVVQLMGGGVTLVAIAALHAILRRGGRSERLDSRGPTLAWICLVGIAVIFGLSYALPIQSGWARGGSPVSGEPDRPNILLVVWDTVRADRMSVYGYHHETTPFLEDLAAESVVFDNAYAASPWTLPSHASLFTGMYPSQHGAHAEHMVLDASFRTAAEILGENGYQTVCFSNNAYISGYHNMIQGFQDNWYKGRWVEDIERRSHGVGKRIHSFLSWLGDSLNKHIRVKIMENPASLWDNPDASITNEAVVEWLDRGREADTPFFLFINYMDAHLPYNPKDSIARQFLDEDELKASYRKDLRYPPFEYLLDHSKRPYSETDIHIVGSLYDACIRYLDDELRKLVAKVDELGIGENTLIIITSDHGEYLGERNRLAHGLGLHDELLHVPLLIRHPDLFEPDTRDANTVTHIDIFETMLAAAA